MGDLHLSELLQYKNIVIQCHDFPDADALASGYGIYAYLKENGREPDFIYSGKQRITKPNLLHMIEELEIPVKYVDRLDPPEPLVTVDCCYGEGNVTRFEAQNIFVIDHHLYGSECPYRNEIKSTYSSCATVIAWMMRTEGFNYNNDRKLATALYYGLYTDSNGMDEINHPADRDLRDLTDYDEITLTLLKNTNLSLEEMKIAGDALKHYKYDLTDKYAIVEARPCDPNILGFISDLLLQVDKVDTCVVFCSNPFGIKLSIRSCINDIKAKELAEYITREMGSGGGHAQKAGGYLKTVPDGMIPGDYINNRIKEYYTSFDIIHAAEYDIDISTMKKYRKKPVTVGYVKSSDILPSGSEICVRTLEADFNLRTADDLLIMVGVRGEVYPISTDKFKTGYTIINERFISKAEYTPAIIDKSNFSQIVLEPYIHACKSKGTTGIYARKLERAVKIYTSWDKYNYVFGDKGDFIAVRCDDLHDIYIIEGSIFMETYEES